MSLKTFHIFFIGVSAVFTFLFAEWSNTQFIVTGSVAYLIAGVLSAIAGGGLIWYAYRFLRKLKKVSLL
jgi:hypothetical protein